MEKTSEKLWSYTTAESTIPYIRPILGEIRTAYITVWHLFKMQGYNNHGPYEEEMSKIGERGRELLEDMKKLSVLVYSSPMRGIVLFPCVVNCTDDCGATPRPAYLVYKDSRETIDSFIFHDEFITYEDLYGWEHPVPEYWKKVGARLDLFRT